MKEITQIQSYIYSIKSLHAGQWRITIDTDENVKPETISYLSSNIAKPGWFIHLSDRKIQPDDITNLPEINATKKGSPSQKLRFTMEKYFEKVICHGQQYENEEFQAWYEGQIEKIKLRYIEGMNG